MLELISSRRHRSRRTTRVRSFIFPWTSQVFSSRATLFLSTRFGILIVILTSLLIIAGVGGARESGIFSTGTFAFSPADSGKISAAQTSGKSYRLVNFDIRVGARGNLDRVIKKSAPSMNANAVAATAKKQKSDLDASLKRLQAKRPGAEASLSPLTGALEVLRSPNGLSSAAHGMDASQIVRDFLSRNSRIYGLAASDLEQLDFIGESTTPVSGLRMVRVAQNVNGIPVFQSETRFILDREGRIIRSLGLMVPEASSIASGISNLIPPDEALARTMSAMGVQLDAARIRTKTVASNNTKFEIEANDPRISRVTHSRLVYFPAAPGVLIPAWSQTIFGANADWYILVDASDGTLLWRKNIRSDASTHEARFRVFVQADGSTPADSPAPKSPTTALPGAGTQFAGISPTIVNMSAVQNLTASPNGWIDDCPGGVCTTDQTQTIGNNVVACMDADIDPPAGSTNVCDTSNAFKLDGNGRPTGNPDTNGRNRDFLGTSPRVFDTNFLPPPQGGDPESGQTASGNGSSGNNAVDSFRRGAVTQLFYTTNWFHDKLFALGFDPSAGNFQNNNFAGGGLGNDRVLADAQDGSGTNNANFATPSDGISGRMQMFLFTGPTIDRDGGLDAEIVIHELTHGVSNRLIGNAAGLLWDIGGSMGEGWSDFYALSLLNNSNADDPNGNYATGAYATYKLATLLDNYVYGIRRFPYSTNNAVNPLTWGDLDQTTYDQSGGIAPNPLGFEFAGALEVHNGGEIWANTLWEVRSRIIADPAGANGDVPTGNQTMLRIVTDGMKLTPLNPSFTEARDALIDADCAANLCANEASIWAGFADRGLGYGSSAPLGVQVAFVSAHIGVKESFASPNLDVNTITIDDSLSIGNGTGFVDPNEPFHLKVNLKNPWRNSSKGIASATATLTSSTPGVNIINGSTTYPAIAAQGNAVQDGNDFVIQTAPTTACGASINFALEITSSLGTVTRNFSIRTGQPSGTSPAVTYTQSALGLAIPDNDPVGIVDTLNITDDLEIADVNLRLDSLTHTFVGDLTVGIRGPNGFGTDLISLAGCANTICSGGDNFTNTVVDDEAVGDFLTILAAGAPYTGSFFPVFNSPAWAVINGASPDATPSLSRFDGTSTLGDWKIVVSDQGALDVGTLNSWSLIVTPRNFACTSFIPTAAGVSISGRVIDSTGKAIRRAVITLTDGTGAIRTARTNQFGFFRITNVAAGQTYLIDIAAKNRIFVPQALLVDDDLTGLTFTALP